MNASEIIKNNTAIINEEAFYEILREFRNGYLKECAYFDRLGKHRQPLTVMYDTLRDLYNRIRDIQYRAELQDIDSQNKAVGYATTIINEIWKADKSLKTLYSAITLYCKQRSKDFNTIAIHVAEYRAVNLLAKQIKRSIRDLEKKGRPPLGVGPIVNDVHIINPDAFVKALEQIKCGNYFYFEASDMLLVQYPTEPHKNYQTPTNFPQCCPYHSNLLKTGMDKFHRFPDCCEPHRRLKTTAWFKKEDYEYMPWKVLTTIDYTLNWVYQYMNQDNWYSEITDYIEYSIKSYGQFPDGYGFPLGLDFYLSEVKDKIENADNLSENKRFRLSQFLEDYTKRSEKAITSTDINLMVDCYQRWLKIFPFDLEFFRDLRPYFENRIPIIKGEGKTNKYTGLTGFAIRNQQELMDFLLQTTTRIVQAANSKVLYEQGRLSNLDETQLALLNAKRQMEIENYVPDGWKDRQGYVRFLKQWFKEEKKYLNEIGKILSHLKKSISFNEAIIRWIEGVQADDVNESCIRSAKDNPPGLETEFRYSLKTALRHRFPKAILTTEEEKGKGRIDLRMIDPTEGKRVVEFKGWWNHDRADVASQICSYLTDFDQSGYIVMINHLKTSSITDPYKAQIINSDTGFLEGSWRVHKVSKTNFVYYESRHKLSVNERTLFHFILDIHSSNGQPKKKSKRK